MFVQYREKTLLSFVGIVKRAAFKVMSLQPEKRGILLCWVSFGFLLDEDVILLVVNIL